MLLRNTLIGTGSLLIAQVALAADETKSPWSGEAELGAVITSGNTETQSVNAKAKVSYIHNRWTHTASFEALQTEDENTTTAERFRLSGKSDYKFSKRGYLYATATYEDDKFSGFDYQATESVGYGHRLIDKKGLLVTGEIGPGARQNKLDTGDTENEFIVRGAGNLTWDISKTTKFTEELTVESGSDNTITRSVAGLSAQVIGSLAMKASLTVKHSTDVPVGVEETDTETALTLVYSF